MSSKVQKRAASESLLFLLIIGGVLILLNILAAYFNPGRLDLTKARLFSLAEGSKNVAANLSDRMEIVAYFTADLPPPFNATERHVRDILEEYEAASRGNVKVRFINPDNEELQQEARSDGVQPVAHQNIEQDQVSVVEGYRGMVLKYLGEKKTIPVIQDTTGLEYTVTTAMKELSGDKKPVGLLSGHEGPTLQEGLSQLSNVLPTYELKEVDATEEIDQDLAALLIIGPQDVLTDVELRHVDQYVMRGGALGIFGGALKVTLAGGPPSAEPVNTALNTLLESWGLSLQPKVVADAQCSRAPMRGPLGFQVLVPYPPIPVVQLTEEQAEHPVLFRLASPMMPFSAIVDVKEAPAGVTVTSLANSSDQSWAMSGTSIQLQPRNPREWSPSSERGPFTMMAALEGPLPSAFASAVSTDEASEAIQAPPQAENPVRVLVAGTSTFLEDAFLPPTQPGQQVQLNAALSLALNAIDWLAADSDLIAIRAKTVEDPALDIPDSVLAAETEARDAARAGDKAGVEKALAEGKAAIKSWDTKKMMYRMVNSLGIPIAFALFGMLRWRQRTNKKRTLTL